MICAMNEKEKSRPSLKKIREKWIGKSYKGKRVVNTGFVKKLTFDLRLEVDMSQMDICRKSISSKKHPRQSS